MTATELRKRAAERRRAGWELMDPIIPDEMDRIADELDRLNREVSSLRDVLTWSEEQCSGKCAGAIGSKLRK